MNAKKQKKNTEQTVFFYILYYYMCESAYSMHSFMILLNDTPLFSLISTSLLNVSCLSLIVRFTDLEFNFSLSILNFAISSPHLFCNYLYITINIFICLVILYIFNNCIITFICNHLSITLNKF